jgi:predicted phosphodiesterase
MQQYRAMWVDDHWAPVTRPEAEVYKQDEIDGARTLKSLHDALNHELKQKNVKVEWILASNLAEAFRHLNDASCDLRLAVLDGRYPRETEAWNALGETLQRRGMPFLVFTHFIDEVGVVAMPPEQQRLCLGQLAKDEDGKKLLIARILGFFEAPPLRLLHLSDLHYDSQATGRQLEEQRDLFKSLLAHVKSLHADAPFDCIAMTGDFAARKPEEDLIKIQHTVVDFIDATVGQRNLDRCLIIPGNHDLQWADFAKKELARQPWRPYLDFYRSIYFGRPELVGEMDAWEGTRPLLKEEVVAHQLSFHRRLDDLKLSVTGFATARTEAQYQGQGIFTRECDRFIAEQWRDRLAPGEVRIALLHHNLLAPVSLSRHEEPEALMYAGDAMHSLLAGQCSLVLSGHTHNTMAFRLGVARLHSHELQALGDLNIVSGGTVGGMHGAADRPRSYNIIEIGDAHSGGGSRAIWVRPCLYDSQRQKWTTGTARDISAM